MPNATALRGCGNGSGRSVAGSALLPVNPFYAPRYHFGMLLGVDDFESEQAYHRGKMRLHNAWLHGEGVVWGLRVDAPTIAGDDETLNGEIRVHPGLALDPVGRELYLAAPACVSVPAWYEAHKDDPELQEVIETAEDGTITFDAHVVARFRACLSRPVPAISEPCVGSGGDTAYSRTQETIELILRPGLAPSRVEPYHRLRLLFAIAEPTMEEGVVSVSDQEVLDARAAILALPSEAQPAAYLEAFRRFAAFDEIDLAPATTESGDPTLFPALDDAAVVLANIEGITLTPDGESLSLSGLEIDNTVRPSHVATSTIQELLCGPLFALAAADDEEEDPEEGEEDEEGGGEGEDEGDGEDGEDPDGGEGDGNGEEEGDGGGPDPIPDAGGPRIDASQVTLDGEHLSLTFDRPVAPGSVTSGAFSITAFDVRGGWQDLALERPPRLNRGRTTVRMELPPGFNGTVVRIIVRGTGPTPILAADMVPLAGSVGGPPGSANDGNDFVLMLKRSET